MTLDARLLDAIGRAVHRAGGDLADVEDLVQTWERLERDWQPRVDRMRYEVAAARYACADRGDEPSGDVRSRRCHGKVRG